MKLRFSEIAAAVGGELLGADGWADSVGTDSRAPQAGGLFVALPGERFDGHDFAAAAVEAGAAAVLAQRPTSAAAAHILVADSLQALAELAGFWRGRMPARVVGVTGSNGKTTVKEMIAAILATQGDTLATQGNLNNHIGAPLTLLRLRPEHRFAVVEMGANHAGEIAHIAAYAKPDISVITNAGPAHIAGFGDVAGVARAKGEIIQALGPAGAAVLNRDDEFYPFWRGLAGGRDALSFGLHGEADVRAEDICFSRTRRGGEESDYVTRFLLSLSGERIEIELGLLGRHNVVNAAAAAAVAWRCGVDLPGIKRGLEQLRPVTGRLQPLPGRGGVLVIDDTYNANPASLAAALQVLDPARENWLALGAFAELGEDSPALHREIGLLLNRMPVTRLFAQGEGAEHTVAAFAGDGRFFADQAQLIEALLQALTGRETLLIKGSRSQRMERVAAALVDNYRAA